MENKTKERIGLSAIKALSNCPLGQHEIGLVEFHSNKKGYLYSLCLLCWWQFQFPWTTLVLTAVSINWERERERERERLLDWPLKVVVFLKSHLLFIKIRVPIHPEVQAWCLRRKTYHSIGFTIWGILFIVCILSHDQDPKVFVKN